MLPAGDRSVMTALWRPGGFRFEVVVELGQWWKWFFFLDFFPNKFGNTSHNQPTSRCWPRLVAVFGDQIVTPWQMDHSPGHQQCHRWPGEEEAFKSALKAVPKQIWSVFLTRRPWPSIEPVDLGVDFFCCRRTSTWVTNSCGKFPQLSGTFLKKRTSSSRARIMPLQTGNYGIF